MYQYILYATAQSHLNALCIEPTEKIGHLLGSSTLANRERHLVLTLDDYS